MSELRKAAEMALEALEWNYGTDLENIENCMAWLDKMNATIPALRQALAQPDEVLAEREACAKVCEDIESEAYGKHRQKYDPYDEGVAAGALACVEAIRARGDK